MVKVDLPRESILQRHRWHAGEALWLTLALAVWFVFPDYLSLGTSVLVMVLLVLSYDLLLGFAGILSIGHAVFFGLGAYTAAWLALAGFREPIAVVLIAGAGSALLAGAVGPFLLRLTGLPLMMVTLALGAVVFEAANKMNKLTGGDDGLSGFSFDPVLGFFEWGLGGRTSYLYVLAWLVLGYLVAKRVAASPFGVLLQGIRENRARMQLIGNGVLPHLTAVYAISGAMAGAAGALFTQANVFVGLGVVSLDVSVDVLVMLVLGGVGGLHGALVGVPLYMVLKHFASQWNPHAAWLIVGALLIAVVLPGRGGALGLLKSLRRRRPPVPGMPT